MSTVNTLVAAAGLPALVLLSHCRGAGIFSDVSIMVSLFTVVEVWPTSECNILAVHPPTPQMPKRSMTVKGILKYASKNSWNVGLFFLFDGVLSFNSIWQLD